MQECTEIWESLGLCLACLGGGTRPPVAVAAASSPAKPSFARRSSVAAIASAVGTLLLLETLASPLRWAGSVEKVAGEDPLGMDWNSEEFWSKPPYFFRFAAAFSRSDAINSSSCTRFHNSFELHTTTLDCLCELYLNACVMYMLEGPCLQCAVAYMPMQIPITGTLRRAAQKTELAVVQKKIGIAYRLRTLRPWSLPSSSMYSNFCSLVNTRPLDLSSGMILWGPFLAMYSNSKRDL
jgi:hypothetical protein